MFGSGVDLSYMIEVLVLYFARMPSNFDFLLACVNTLLSVDRHLAFFQRKVINSDRWPAPGRYYNTNVSK